MYDVVDFFDVTFVTHFIKKNDVNNIYFVDDIIKQIFTYNIHANILNKTDGQMRCEKSTTSYTKVRGSKIPRENYNVFFKN